MSQLIVERSNQFKRDVKKMVKRGKNKDQLKVLMRKLAFGDKLHAKFRDHALTGNYRGTRECHIEPDWLLIYTISKTVIRFERTGTHSDLF